MIATKSLNKTKKLAKKAKKNNKLIGFVPTMGALHPGHLALIRKAKRESNYLIVSIFINPLQFGPKEDFKKYPRNLKKDKNILKKEGIDLLFFPQINQIYPLGFSTYIQEVRLSKILCGRRRPNHFKGVSTVVAKLFNITSADLAYFGQKDYQQALIIKKMVKDLNLPLKIKIAPIVREKDKLAFSSRNLYLNKNQRQQSKIIYQSLLLAKKMIKENEKNPKKIIKKMKKAIESEPDALIDYIEIRNARTLGEMKKIKGLVFVGVAVFFGKTRLIDNIIIKKSKVQG